MAQTHNKLPPLHEFFVDNLTGIVFSRFDVDGFLQDTICRASQLFLKSVLVDDFF
jgi:hypothetical protein